MGSAALSPAWLVGGRVAGPLGGYEARDDAVRTHGGGLDSSPCMAEASDGWLELWTMVGAVDDSMCGFARCGSGFASLRAAHRSKG